MRRGPLLVHGFGPFRDITENPAATLATAVDGARAAGRAVVGEVMPVIYRRGPALSARRARSLSAAGVVGIGVAVRRHLPVVECRAFAALNHTLLDVDGVGRSCVSQGGQSVRFARGPLEAIAAALGGIVGADPGRYVCNAWLYEMLTLVEADVPVVFVHVPARGLDPARLLGALESFEEYGHGR